MKPVDHLQLLTDRGRKILLFQFEPMVVAAKGSESRAFTEDDRRRFLDVGEQIFLASTMGDARCMTRLVEPRTECNCHGWIFASRQFGIYGSQVSAILEDNGYGVVQDPRDGDIAIYWQRGMPVHSGIVRISPLGPGRLIESKWGPFGVYLHQQEVHPFSGDCSYYRSARRGHANVIQGA